MVLKCTDEQAKAMATVAIMESVSVISDIIGPIRIDNNGEINIDIFNGFPVHFSARRANDGWEFADEVDINNQPWASKYFGYDRLFEFIVSDESNQKPL